MPLVRSPGHSCKGWIEAPACVEFDLCGAPSHFPALAGTGCFSGAGSSHGLCSAARPHPKLAVNQTLPLHPLSYEWLFSLVPTIPCSTCFQTLVHSVHSYFAWIPYSGT